MVGSTSSFGASEITYFRTAVFLFYGSYLVATATLNLNNLQLHKLFIVHLAHRCEPSKKYVIDKVTLTFLGDDLRRCSSAHFVRHGTLRNPKTPEHREQNRHSQGGQEVAALMSCYSVFVLETQVMQRV